MNHIIVKDRPINRPTIANRPVSRTINVGKDLVDRRLMAGV